MLDSKTVDVEATLLQFFERHAVRPTNAYVNPSRIEHRDGRRIGVYIWMGHYYRYDLDSFLLVSVD